MTIETLAGLALNSGQDILAIPRIQSAEKSATSGVTNPEQWFRNLGGGGPTSSGFTVTPNNSLQCVAVWACTNLIANSIAQLPLFLMERLKGDDRDYAWKHPVYPLLHDQPIEWMTSFEWRHMMQTHVLLRGNAYSFIQFDNFGKVKAIVPLHPDRVWVVVDEDDGQPFYYVNDRFIRGVFPKWQIFHLKGLSSDGYTGLSVISAMREAIGLSMTTQEYSGKLYANGTMLPGVIEFPEKLDDKIVDRLRQNWTDTYVGSRNSGKPLILESGMKWHAIGMTSNDAQMILTRAFQNAEIYRAFGVPPHMVGDMDKSSSWGTGIEQMSIGFVTYTLQPWIVRWEQAIHTSLLKPNERPGFYAHFNIDGLLRADAKSRAEAFSTMRQNGVINADEWRAREDMPPIGGQAGTAYMVNGAMIASELVGGPKQAGRPASE